MSPNVKSNNSVHYCETISYFQKKNHARVHYFGRMFEILEDANGPGQNGAIHFSHCRLDCARRSKLGGGGGSECVCILGVFLVISVRITKTDNGEQKLGV